MRAGPREVPVTVRTASSKGARRQLRAAGRVPAIVYGRGMEQNLLVAVEERVFRRDLPETGWHSTPLKLIIQDPGYADFSPTVMVPEVQRDIVTGRIVSVDFHVVTTEEKLHTQVPVVHRGQSPGVRSGGILEHLVHEVAVESKLADLPEEFVVDVSSLDIGERVRVADLPVPPGVTILSPADEVILLVAPPRVAEEAAPAAPGAVVEEVTEPQRIGEEEKEG